MTDAPTTAVRIPTVLDTTQIETAGSALRIHPDDLAELQEAYFFCWPGNAPADVFRGTKLIVDAEAGRLPRKRL